MIKTAIFDFDGTLADTIPLCREAFRRAIQKLDGRILTDEEIERQFGPDDLGVIQKLIPGKPELHERGRELFIHYYRKLHADLAPAPFPGTAELLSTLRNLGIRLAMVTGKRLESAEISLQFFICPNFSYSGNRLPGGRRKTRPHQTGSVPSECRRLRSHLYWRRPHRRGRMPICPYPHSLRRMGRGGGHQRPQGKKPDFLLTRFEDLERFFREHHENEGL